MNIAPHAFSLHAQRALRLKWTFFVVTLAVLALAAGRLLKPMTAVHYKVDREGQVLATTRDPYRGIAGTVYAQGLPLALSPADTLNDPHRQHPSQRLLQHVAASDTLSQALAPALNAGLTDFSRHAYQGGTPIGRRLLLTLDEGLQRDLLATSSCFTGRIDQCKSTLPLELLAANRRFTVEGSGLRAGVAAFLVVKEDSGEILAMGGTVSPCVSDKLRRRALRRPDGSVPIFAGPGDPCSQLPDVRHAPWLGLPAIDPAQLAPGEARTDIARMLPLDPAHWPIPPGSAAKKELAIACIRAGLMPESDAEARLQFARSSDNDFFRRLALRCVDSYREVYTNYARPLALLHPTAVLKGAGYPGWIASAVPAQLPVGPTLDAAQYLALDGKAARTDRRRLRLDTATFQRLQTSRDLSTIAIGNGGHLSTLAQHANSMRLLGLASRGRSSAAVMHLVRDPDEPLPEVSTAWMPDAAGSRRVLRLLGGVTGPQGTASAACRLVAAPCPKDGLVDLAGKTGTSDIADAARPDQVKRGFADAIPSKFFVARFQARGETYVVCTYVLRSRDPATGHLDESNAAAELGLLARRRLLEALKS